VSAWGTLLVGGLTFALDLGSLVSLGSSVTSVLFGFKKEVLGSIFSIKSSVFLGSLVSLGSSEDWRLNWKNTS